mmetsp:Transcript_20758/g.57367  ORF Transcript_20758/g.57367 Transcript_20758/m.57367 type:complete len:631 (+) Transcript_20758:1259-3151(+)
MVEDVRARSSGAKVVAMLTGDFLSPYLLSTVDHGYGMMRALNAIPLDYIIWGNHEADIDHKIVCRHVENFKGRWINSNMLDHDAMEHQQEYDVIELASVDGTHSRKVGLCAVLSHDPKLYEHFQEPGAFGGATITDPWEALRKYQRILEQDEGCDVVVPLQHLYVPDDHKTCEQFDFPVILSGHDHHRVDEVHCGTRLIKPGMNADFASVVELSWKDGSTAKPKVSSRFVRCKDWEADPICAEENERAYDALIPLRKTELAQVPKEFEPLSSNNARGSTTTMGKFICTLIKRSLNNARKQRKHAIDAVLLMGGNIRGGTDYPEGSFFSMEAMEAEIKSDEVIGVVTMPGWLLAEGIQATHLGPPIPGWMQYDNGVIEDTSVHPPVVTHVGGEPIEPDRVYRVATKVSDLTGPQSPPWQKYYLAHPEVMPPKGNYVNINAELFPYFARTLWRRLWQAITEEISSKHAEDGDEQNPSSVANSPSGMTRKSSAGDLSKSVTSLASINSDPSEYMSVLDRTGDGTVTVEEIQLALKTMLGVSIDKREKTFAKFIHDYADTTGNGKITITDIRHFCKELNDDGAIADGKLRVSHDTDSESTSSDSNDDSSEGYGHEENLIEASIDEHAPMFFSYE